MLLPQILQCVRLIRYSFRHLTVATLAHFLLRPLLLQWQILERLIQLHLVHLFDNHLV